MKFHRKSEWFILDRPIAEPNEKWNPKNQYHIERIVTPEGTIVWFGCSINWKKEPHGNWTELTTNYDAKPIEKYLPEKIYGDDRIYWKECDTPVYEKLYKELYG